MLLISISIILTGWSNPEEKKNALWVEDTDLTSETEDIIKKSKQNEINTIYLKVDSKHSPSVYKNFIRKASEEEIDVHALGGKPSWALKANQQALLDFSHWVQNYNSEVNQNEQFAGIHLKIQPQLLEQWYTNAQTILKEWKGNIRTFTEDVHASKRLETSASIPFWLDEVKTPNKPETTFNKWLISQFDHTTILAFRDTLEGQNGVVSLIEDELNIANELGKKIVVGITLEDTGQDYVSFYEEGIGNLNMHLNILEHHLKEEPSYIGFAVDRYSHWSSLEKTTEEKTDEETDESDESTNQNPSSVKGTYIWHASNLIESPDEILEFAKEKNLNFLYTRLDRRKDFSAYKSFVERAHKAGIEVHAMGGHPNWALAKGEERLKMFINYVTTYNNTVAEEQKFDGIHLDIEPYVLPEWSKDKNGVLRTWKDNIELFVDEVKKESELETSVDLAMWLDDHEIPGEEDSSFSRWMINQLDHTTLMAFRDYAKGSGGILDVSKEEMEFATNLDKPIIISVEMKQNESVEHISFHEEGEKEMEEALEQTEEELSQKSSYKGYVVHAYDYWLNAED